MEKVKRYKSVAKAILTEIAARKNQAGRTINYQVVADEVTGNFLLLRNAWRGGVRLYGIIIHIEVKENTEVWLQQDATDLVIADLLLEKGVAADDLVLGFLAPAMRADMELAA